MRSENRNQRRGRTLRWVYGLTLAVLVFTGMGQMPIYKRYGISDLPGMEWAADFYATVLIHYAAAALLLGLLAYGAAEHLLSRRKAFRVTVSGYVRGGLLAGLALTGTVNVMLNRTPGLFGSGLDLWLILSHLALAMAFLVTALVTLVGRRAWVVRRAGTCSADRTRG